MNDKKIVVGFDRSKDALAAARWALDEAARTGAPVEFFYAYEWPQWAPAASMVPSPAVWPDGETELAITESLQNAVAAARQSHPAVRTEISTVRAGTAPTLIERSRHAGLIVVGSQGNSAVAGLLGSVSVAVSAHAHCPVVVVRGDAAPTLPVVAGVDDSPAAQLALEFAAEQAAGRGVPLRVIRTWPPVTGIWAETPMATRTVTADERRPFDETVAALRDRHPKLEISAEAVVDHPAHALVLASTTAQLLVVGTRGRGALRGTLLGSVSQHLLRHSACGVAVVRERPAA